METIPILPSAGFQATASFWARFGFEARGRWDDYLLLRHEGLAIELHFWLDEALDRWTNDVACFVRFSSPEAARACHEQWDGIEVPAPGVLSLPRDDARGATEFHIIDLDGNLVRLGGFPPGA